MSGTLGHPPHNVVPFPPPAAPEEDARQAFNLLDVTQAASRFLGVGVNEPALAAFAGQLLPLVNQRDFHRSGLEGSSFRQLLLQNLPRDVAQLVDPAQADKLRKERAAMAGNDPSKKLFDPFIGGVGRMGAQPADRGSNDTGGNNDGSIVRASGGYVRSDASAPGGYQSLSYESPLALMGITKDGFGLTLFGKKECGLNFDTFKSLRQYNFTGSQILGGVRDAKDILGPKLDVNGEGGAALVRDTAGLRKEAPKQAAGIVKALKKEAEMMPEDPHLKSAVGDAVDSVKSAASEEKLNAAAQAVNKAADAVEVQSGAKAAISDPSLSPAARAYAVDAGVRTRQARVKLMVAEQCRAKGASPGQCAVFQERVEKARLEAGGAPPLPMPAVGAPAFNHQPLQHPASQAHRRGAKVHKADVSGDRRGGLAALPRRVADAAMEANEVRGTVIQERDSINARNASQVAEMSEFFSSTNAEVPTQRSPKENGGPLQKADAQTEPKKSAIKVALRDAPKTEEAEQKPGTAKNSDVGKKPETAKTPDPAPVRTAMAAKSNLGQPKPA